MKKRILSIALAVVMVVAMIPVAMVSAFADFRIANDTAIDTYYGDVEITLDGQRDAIYTQSEKIVNKYTYGSGTGFEAYYVATSEGLYFYADVIDSTIGYDYMATNSKRGAVNDVSNHDKLQVYYAFGGTWGYVEFDYFYNNVDSTFVPGDLEEEKPLHHARFRHAKKSIDTNDILDTYFQAATTADPEAGKWTAEFFLPWTTAENLDGTAAPYACGIGVQVNNDDYNNGKLARKGYCYNVWTGSGWWQGPDKSDLVALKYIGVETPSTAAATYQAAVTTNEIVVDGQIDEVYYDGTHITEIEHWSGSKNTETFGFDAYTAATLEGFYVYINVQDTTMNNIAEGDTDPLNGGDRIQFYFDWTPIGYRHDDGLYIYTNTRDYLGSTCFYGGWIGVDYNDNLNTGAGRMGELKAGMKRAITKFENPDWDGTDPQTQYIGYAVELFVPWNQYMANMVGTQDVAHFGFGIEVQDDGTYDDSTTRTSICGTPGCMSYWTADALLPDIVLNYGDTPTFLNDHYGDIVDSATVDGINTNGEYDDAQVIHVNLAGGGTADDGDIYRVITDGKSIYVLMEMVDATPSDHTKKLGEYYDYTDFFFSFGDRLATYASFYRDYFKKDTFTNEETFEETITYTWADVRSGGYNGSSIKFAPELGNFAVIDNRENGWTVEIKIDLTEEEQAQLAAGTLEIGLGAQFLDGHADGRNYKYDEAVFGGNFWNNNATYINRYSSVRFVDASPMIVDADLTGAQVALGESISVNFFANLSVYDTDAKLKVTYHDTEYVLGAQKTDVANEYKFVFEGIAPQCMKDYIDAELIVDGVVVETLENYSVWQNTFNIWAADSSNQKLTSLVGDLWAYGAAAQKYANYKTDDLINQGYTHLATTVTSIDAGKTLTQGEAITFKAAGVYFDNINKLYAKVIIPAEAIEMDTFAVTVNGAPVAFAATGNANEYIIYTDDILVTDFDADFTFVVTDGVDEATLVYSVNAYCNAKLNASNTNTAALAAATYAYGASAEAYVG